MYYNVKFIIIYILYIHYCKEYRNDYCTMFCLCLLSFKGLTKMHRFQEESFFYHTLFDFKDIVDQFGDRVWEELELHCPALYESFCAYKANKDVDEYLSNQAETRWNDGCDYWDEEDECND